MRRYHNPITIAAYSLFSGFSTRLRDGFYRFLVGEERRKVETQEQ